MQICCSLVTLSVLPVLLDCTEVHVKPSQGDFNPSTGVCVAYQEDSMIGNIISFNSI